MTKKQIEHLFVLFCNANGFKIAKKFSDVGGYALDYYGIGGGYMIVQIANANGGHSTPFGHVRRKAKEFASVLSFGIDLARAKEVHTSRPGKPYSQYANNPLRVSLGNIEYTRGGKKHQVEPNPARRKKFKGPFKVQKWEERDRLHIMLVDKDENEVASWWDDDARQMFEDGFFNARRLDASVTEYARENGLI